MSEVLEIREKNRDEILCEKRLTGRQLFVIYTSLLCPWEGKFVAGMHRLNSLEGAPLWHCLLKNFLREWALPFSLRNWFEA